METMSKPRKTKLFTNKS